MMKMVISLFKTGTLSILHYLNENCEPRFGEIVSKLNVPMKTASLRMIELRKAGLVTRSVRQKGTDGVGYHVYVLTENGLRFVNRLGTESIGRLLAAEKDLQTRQPVALETR